MQTVRLILLGLLLFLPAIAQTQGPLAAGRGVIGKHIEVRFLYPCGKNFQHEAVYPLVVEYHNISRTPQSFKLSWNITVPIPPEYEELTLEPGEKKRLPLIFPPRAVGSLYSMEVNGQSVNPALGSNAQNAIIGVLAPGEGAFDYLRSLQVEKSSYYNPADKNSGPEYGSPQAMSTLDADVFPEHWAELESLQVLVCHDLATLGLSNFQYEAIINWTRMGGHLVLVTNGVPTEYRGTPLQGVLPLEPKGVSTTNKLLRLTGELAPGALATDGGPKSPLVIRQSLGDGKITFLTSPLLETDLLGKKATESLWRSILAPPADSNSNPYNYNYNYNYNSIRIFRYALLDKLPELPRARAGWIALYVILYGIIVGPVNLTLLRRKDKMLWSFITVPLVAAAFAGGAYLANSVIRPSSPVLRELGWVRFLKGQSFGISEAEQLFFSPDARSYPLSSSSRMVFDTYQNNYGVMSSPRQLEMLSVAADGGLKSHLGMGTWDIQRFNCRGVVGLEAAFELSFNKKDSTLTYQSPVGSSEESAFITVPGLGTSQLFTLKKGKQNIKLTFSSVPPSSVGSWDGEKFPGRQEVLNALANNAAGNPQTMKSDRSYLYAWSDQVGTDFTVGTQSKRLQDTLLLVEFEK